MTETEWLNNQELPLRIWNKKYRKDESETFEDWLTRVSGGNEEVKQLIREKKFLFAGRILSNRGISDRKGTLSNCFLAGNLVLTKKGFIPIEDVKVGDYVITHDGSFQKVNNVIVREYKGDIYKISGNELLKDIYCTPNHKFLTGVGEWKEIQNFNILSEKKIKVDRLRTLDCCIPDFNPFKFDLLNKYVFLDNTKLYQENDKVGISLYVNDRGTLCWRKPKLDNLVNRYITVDKDFSYFIGRWLGDGSVTCRKGKQNPSILQIVFNAEKEYDSFLKCKRIGERAFGILSSCRQNDSQNTLILRFENELISTWFLNNFGQKCDGKFIHPSFKYNFYTLLGLLDSDGSVHSNGSFKLLLKNRNLINWARECLYFYNINTSPVKEDNRQDAAYFTISAGQTTKLLPLLSKQYSDDRMDINLDRNTHIKISSIDIIKDIDTLVYNLSVENNHSYIVNGAIAHNCYVLPAPEDNLESIFKTASDMARTFSYGGGVGIDLSHLRPFGAKVNNAALTTSGPVGFMELYSQTTNTIAQNGRRGALLLSMDINHPDIEQFIDIKTDLSKVNYANISVRVNDNFMYAVEKDEDYILHWPCNSKDFNYHVDCDYNTLYKTVSIHDEVIYYKKIKARDLFNKLVKNNWNYAEPGILYWDRVCDYNLLNNTDIKPAGVNP